MSNSFRRRPFSAMCGGSQQQDKRIGNRAMRRINRVALIVSGEDAAFARMEEVMDVWSMPQDGTRRYKPYDGSYAGLTYRDWYKWTKAK